VLVFAVSQSNISNRMDDEADQEEREENADSENRKGNQSGENRRGPVSNVVKKR